MHNCFCRQATSADRIERTLKMLDCPNTHLARPGDKLAARFAREDGNIATLAMIMFVLMLSVGGLAVDLMRYEEIRTSLQQSLDRCTLAAASLTQELDPETVCLDYVSKAGHTQDVTDVTVTEGINFREVSADAMAIEKPFFAHMVGIEQFDIPAASVAEQRITDIEIAMVLDISGSMVNTPSRIANLKIAGKDFVNSVLANDAEQRTSILIVPYNGQVNLGPTLRSKFNVTLPSGRTGVDCVDLPSAVYNTLPMSRATPLPNTAHADTYSSTSTSTSYTAYTDSTALPAWANRWCPVSSTGTALSQNIVRMPNNNIATLQSQIDGLTAVGATSINAGMKWGMALLDPSARSLYTEFVTAGTIPATFSGRPFEYTADNDANPTSMKVIVLMTDGEHFPEDRVNDAFKAGSASMWRANSDNNYSRFEPARVDTSTPTKLCDSRPFWVPHLSVWHSRPWTGAAPVASACYAANVTTTTAVTTTTTLQTWPTVWSNLRLSYVAWQFYARAGVTAGGNGLGKNAASTQSRTTIYNDTMNLFRTQTTITAMDAQLEAICDKARDQNVIVFGIAFEAPTNGQAVIQSCATDASHYYATTGSGLTTVFRTIASQISQLRLTQ
jgi:Putative Flp pilus-assembly TadE/G-like